MTALILSGRYTPESIALAKLARAPEWRVERIPHWRVPKLQDESFAIYAEPLFAAHVSSELGLALLEPPLDWISRIPISFQNRHISFATLADARLVTAPAFIKPADNKLFDARVYPNGSELPRPGVLPETEPVLIAEPVIWEVEFRCFVLEGQVQTLSPYWRSNRSAQTEDEQWPATVEEVAEVRTFAEQVLADQARLLPPAVVLDVGIIQGRGWSVVEANPAWASGFYGCDPERILPVLRRACRKQTELTAEDRRWVIDRKRAG